VKAADAACEVTALLTRELARKFERIRGIVVRRLGAELCLYAWREDGGGIYTCPYCASRHAFVLHEHMIDVCRSDAIQLVCACAGAPERAKLLIITLNLLRKANV